MTIQTVHSAIRYVGVDDNTLALFENQYPVQPMGVSYNSYVILDEKIAVMDSVDARAAEEWLSNVARVLEGRSPDYLVVTHMEPDHSGSLMRLAQKYPEMKIVGNAKTFTMIKQFFGTGALSEDRMLEVGERDTLSLGLHRLRFLLAPMVHWPEVMAAYEEEEKILFSADAFGRFGSLERTARAPWAPQARRVSLQHRRKYGAQVQTLLKKVSALEIKIICPLHGPMLTEDWGSICGSMISGHNGNRKTGGHPDRSRIHPWKYRIPIGGTRDKLEGKRCASHHVRSDGNRPFLCRDQRIPLWETGVGLLHLCRRTVPAHPGAFQSFTDKGISKTAGSASWKTAHGPLLPRG